jgi:hypothetical protein
MSRIDRTHVRCTLAEVRKLSSGNGLRRIPSLARDRVKEHAGQAETKPFK